ncbi:MAG: pilus (MSHA type) biogenesis protein MshL [Methylococcaceae bacterium]|nr:pilus (MSHA type) biogenesis protein MshL [Methylococcaceae bacterium]
MKNLSRLLALTCLMGTTACSPEKQQIDDYFPDIIVPEQANAATPPKEISDALLPDLTQTLNVAQYTQAKPVAERLNISVHELDAREFFMGLVVDSDVNMVVHPEVQGNISLTLKKVTIEQVLATIHKVYGYDYKKTDMGYIIYPATAQTKIFKIDLLDITRKGLSSTHVTFGQSAQNSDSAANTNSNTNSNTGTTDNNSTSSGGSIITETDANFWGELEQSLHALIAGNPEASIALNKQTGVIVVRAKPMQLIEIERFIDATQAQSQRQVILEAKIIEITLDDSHQDGVNWSSIAKQGSQLFLTSVAPLPSFAAQVKDIFISQVQFGDFTAYVELLATQGKTKVLSSPRISTLNNQKAIIKVGRDEYFITDISSNNNSSASTTTTTQDVTWTPFFSGIALDVTPQINDRDQVTLHIHPSITLVESQDKTFTVNDKANQVPLALNTMRESDSIVQAKNGQIIVLGGLMQTIRTESKRGIPWLSELPYLGWLFRTNTGEGKKTELVILLKPTVITDEQTWNQDLSDSKKRLKNYEDYKLWGDTDYPQQ